MPMKEPVKFLGKNNMTNREVQEVLINNAVPDFTK